MSGRQKNSTTIIKRNIRRAHAGGHGGAWKVAFADFMLALMSLFMVMWIMGQVSEKDRKAIMYTLNNQSVFESHSFSPISFSGQDPAPPVSPDISPQAASHDARPQSAQPSQATQTAQEATAETAPDTAQDKNAAPQDTLQTALQAFVAGQKAQNNMRIEKLAMGLRVVVNDDPHRAMFERGSARVTPYFQQLLTGLVPVLDKSRDHMIIIGHTDATPYPQNPYYDNWSLSVDRAQSARQVMIHAGFPGDKIVQLSGVADQKPLDHRQPTNPINRRIEFIILSEQGLAQWEETFSSQARSLSPNDPMTDVR